MRNAKRVLFPILLTCLASLIGLLLAIYLPITTQVGSDMFPSTIPAKDLWG